MSKDRSVMQLDADNQGKLRKTIEKREEIQKLLDRALNEKGALLCTSDGTRFQLRMGEITKKSFMATLMKPIPADWQKKSGVSKLSWVIFAGNLGTLTFEANLLRAQGDECEVEIPAVLERTQSRGEPRYAFPKAYELYIQVGGIDSEHCQMLDLSASGLSFLAPSEAVKKLQVGLTLAKIQFQIRNQMYEMSGEIRGMQATPQGTLVRLEFFRLKDHQRDELRDYVISQLIQYHSFS